MSEQDIAREDELLSLVDHLAKRLADTKAALREIQTKNLNREYGLVPGVTLLRNKRIGGGIYRFDGYHDYTFSSFRKSPWVIGIPQKKDGTFGTRKICLFYQWEVLKEEKV